MELLFRNLLPYYAFFIKHEMQLLRIENERLQAHCVSCNSRESNVSASDASVCSLPSTTYSAGLSADANESAQGLTSLGILFIPLF